MKKVIAVMFLVVMTSSAAVDATAPKPTATFAQKYAQLNALNQTVAEMSAGIKSLQNKMNELRADLLAELPKGYSYDPAKNEFVKDAEPLAPATPTAPAK